MDNIIVPFDIQKDSITDEGIFEGWGVVFNSKIEKRRYDLGTDFDIFRQGSLLDTLAKGGRNGTGVVMLWQHEYLDPIGKWLELQEQKRGLKTKGQLALGVQRGKEAYVLMKMEALNGQSLGFNIIESEPDQKKKVNYVENIDLFEISPVIFPRDKKAIITNVNSAVKDALTIRELEGALRDAGLSRNEATYVSSLCRETLGDQGHMSSDGMNMLLQNLRNINTDFQKFYSGFDFEKQTVIPFKSYPKAPIGEAWSAATQVRAADVKDLKIMSAWYDSANPDLKSSYKLPHHRAKGYNTVWRAVAAAMAALLGARGGVRIPATDRKGVYNHLSKHYKEFEKTPPELQWYSEKELEKFFTQEEIKLSKILK